MKDKKIKRIVDSGRRDYITEAQRKIDAKLGLNVSDEFKNRMDERLGLTSENLDDSQFSDSFIDNFEN